LQVHQDVAQSALDRQLSVAEDPVAGGDARRSQAGDRDLERQLVVEACRPAVAHVGLRDHELDAAVSRTVHLWAETLCLDYANSVDWSLEGEHIDPAQTDVLRTEDMLRRWGRRLELLGERTQPPSAAELRRARTLRDVVYRLFSSISRDKNLASKELDVLMSDYAQAVGHASPLSTEDDFYELHRPAGDP
jgi:Putative stress-induced transcription regulator